MKYITLGRTGIKASVAGLGCGGHSRLGLGKGLGEDNAVKIVKTALDLGINIFDTSAAYGTEEALGKGLADTKRSDYIISTKFPPRDFGGDIRDKSALIKSLEQSMKNLKVDYIDILHLHAVMPEDYCTVRDKFMPELIKAKESGKIGWFGVTEMFNYDTSHKMLEMALTDNIWDVIMTGYNMLNFSASRNILPLAKDNNVGTLLMFAVRNALSKKEILLEVLNDLNEKKQIDISQFDRENPLGFLTNDGVADSIVEAAYRFCRHSDGIDVVLSGTSSYEHLKDNVKSILSEKLPTKILDKIYHLFGNVDSVSAG